MEYPLTHRNPPTPTPPSPRLVRSRSGAENNSTSINTSQRFSGRSKSTTRSSNRRSEENIINSSSTLQKKPAKSSQENCCSSSRDGFVRFLQRGNPRNSSLPTNKTPKSASRSPSAWALSPGRSLFKVLPQPDQLPVVGGGSEKRKKVKTGGGAVSGVLKYFRQKKVSSVQEEEYHGFRVLHNTLLQWRFANAKAETAMASVKILAEERVFHVWLRILNLRNIILERRIQVLKLKHEIKLCEIVNPQMNSLDEWTKIERKNCEAVGRITRKLSALSVKLPLVEQATGDVESMYKAMKSAVEVMDSIEATVSKFFCQVEKILYLITELTSTLEHKKEILEELERTILLVAELLAWEKSIKVQLIQVVEESEVNRLFEFVKN